MYFWEKLKSAIKGYSNLVVSCSFLKLIFCNTFFAIHLDYCPKVKFPCIPDNLKWNFNILELYLFMKL